MTQFDEREAAFENKFAHDEELQFKATARRDKLTGLWAAELMGAADAASYAAELVKEDLRVKGDENVIEKLLADFAAAGVEMSRHRIEKALEENFLVAKQQLMEQA